jgi:hypothetical protein
MIDAKQIPDEVVEAAMKHTGWASEYERVALVNHYRTVLAAALEAWPGAETRLEDWHTPPETVLILPLPKEGE